MALMVTTENFEKEVLQSDKPVVIDVFATWCGPCQQMLPLFEELAEELEDTYKLVKLNIDNNRELAVQYNVSSIPTFIFVKGGEVVGKETGSMTKDVLIEKIETHLK